MFLGVSFERKKILEISDAVPKPIPKSGSRARSKSLYQCCQKQLPFFQRPSQVAKRSGGLSLVSSSNGPHEMHGISGGFAQKLLLFFSIEILQERCQFTQRTTSENRDRGANLIGMQTSQGRLQLRLGL